MVDRQSKEKVVKRKGKILSIQNELYEKQRLRQQEQQERIRTLSILNADLHCKLQEKGVDISKQRVRERQTNRKLCQLLKANEELQKKLTLLEERLQSSSYESQNVEGKIRTSKKNLKSSKLQMKQNAENKNVFNYEVENNTFKLNKNEKVTHKGSQNNGNEQLINTILAMSETINRLRKKCTSVSRTIDEKSRIDEDVRKKQSDCCSSSFCSDDNRKYFRFMEGEVRRYKVSE